MKRSNKIRLSNILVVIALIITLVTLVIAMSVKIKYWEYSSLWLLMNKTSETIISFIGTAIAVVLLVISNVLEK